MNYERLYVEEKIKEVRTKLRPYQIIGVDLMVNNQRPLNFDDMGLGKTVSTITAILTTITQHNIPNPKIIILCPTSALYVWQNEFTKWYGLNSIIYTGNKAKRRKIWEEFILTNCNILITTYAMFEELPNIWTAIIFDEIHQVGLLNHKSETFKMVYKKKKQIFIFEQLTGTPILQGMKNLYAPLHLTDPKTFNSYWSYINKYGVTIDTPFGKNIERNPKNIAEFRTMLNKYMIRRIKKEVLLELPEKQRIPVSLQMTPKQIEVYNNLIQELVYNENNNLIIAPNQMTAILRCRQLLVTPRLLGINDDGAGLLWLKEQVEQLIYKEDPFVIFTPFREALTFIKNAILEISSKIKIFQLSGGMSSKEFSDTWKGFQEYNGLKVQIATIAVASAFDSYTASTCFFLGYEWNFNMNAQAEDRLCRMGQKNSVMCYYSLYKGDTTDEMVREKLNSKQDASNWIIGTDTQYKELLNNLFSR